MVVIQNKFLSNIFLTYIFNELVMFKGLLGTPLRLSCATYGGLNSNNIQTGTYFIYYIKANEIEINPLEIEKENDQYYLVCDKLEFGLLYASYSVKLDVVIDLELYRMESQTEQEVRLRLLEDKGKVKIKEVSYHKIKSVFTRHKHNKEDSNKERLFTNIELRTPEMASMNVNMRVNIEIFVNKNTGFVHSGKIRLFRGVPNKKTIIAISSGQEYMTVNIISKFIKSDLKDDNEEVNVVVYDSVDMEI